ncbi:Uncharacterized conserved protein, DUF1501 family [Singulisphaera sp. GP187]|uniref:DUF1501 domain-containing protein n=1 Tax=Singulisphaera sp. GP187 TaxID=1882752 RepID=UPI000925D6B0|nr:DUF1501 domain-containing protein [Singulisphaera sp. GP187]SIO58793.1 Uncharacterized conserved protein, DUF1501 family [Singulisphaera sp. GP187]
MNPTRRAMLRLGLGTQALLACGTSVPTFLAKSARAVEGRRDRVLVVVQLDGGNDGLNTVVPYRDDDYRKHRPRLALGADRVRKIDDRLGFHPALGGFSKLLQGHRLAIVQGVGYPNPNRSHFESMAIWQTARLDPTRDAPGWLARLLDGIATDEEGDPCALSAADGLPLRSLSGGRRYVPTLTGPEPFRRRLGDLDGADALDQRAALDRIGHQHRGTPGSLLQFVERMSTSTCLSGGRLDAVLDAAAPVGSSYPESLGLARRLRLVAQLIKAGLSTSIYYTALGGFDTHADQREKHEGLLSEVGDSLQAFLDDLDAAGHGERVLTLVFSEFGRRLAENGSGGTDHGTAAPVFLLGKGVCPGIHGVAPDLQHLEDGDPKHTTDFRQVYATLLDDWLGASSRDVLGEPFAHVPILRSSESARGS